VQFEEFEALAWHYWQEIPAEYRAGVDGLVIERQALSHPELPEVYTLGECQTEDFPSEYGGPDTIRSAIVLYYGSFLRVSRQSPDFDWEEELWETLTHELQHHLESLAREDSLEGVDYAMDENFKRLEGEPFDPFFYRSGIMVTDDVWRVERDIFLEREFRSEEELGGAGGRGLRIYFEWQETRYVVHFAVAPGDLTFVWVEEGVDRRPGEEVYVVLVRRRSTIGALRAFLARRRLEVVEGVGVAEEVGH
jgi:predicted Zn-dependent protease with MMP-like domain